VDGGCRRGGRGGEITPAVVRCGQLGGGHAQLAHPTKPGLVTVPQHVGEILKPKTLATILEQAGLSVDDLRRLL
jgi:HicA toxin of bacterial toxin-antitoxin,